jgi:hypothetical protein
MSFEIDYEYFRNSENSNRHSNWEFAIDMLADYFGIYKPNKRFYLNKIARFRNENFKKNPSDQELVEELTKDYEQFFRK